MAYSLSVHLFFCLVSNRERGVLCLFILVSSSIVLVYDISHEKKMTATYYYLQNNSPLL
jgi:hypothetical protein